LIGAVKTAGCVDFERWTVGRFFGKDLEVVSKPQIRFPASFSGEMGF
jgi:hypothetical protein